MGKLQDILSGLGKGAAVATLASAIGGSDGVYLAGNVGSMIKAKEKERDLEKVRKTKEALTESRNKLNEDIAREQLLTSKLKNYGDVQKNIMGGAMNPFGGLKASTDKLGSMTEFDVAKESKSGKSGKSAKSKEEKSDTKLPKAVPMSATNPAFEPDEDERLAATKKAISTGRQLGTDLATESGSVNIGKDLYKKTRGLMNEEINKSSLHPEQMKAAAQEFAAKAAPGFREEQAAIVANTKPKYLPSESLANMVPRALDPLMDSAAESLSNFDKYMTAGVTVEERIEDNPELLNMANQLAIRLKRTGIKDYDEASALVPTLMAMNDYKDIPVKMREKMIYYAANQFPKPMAGSSSMIPNLSQQLR